jgi:hypothetical protein
MHTDRPFLGMKFCTNVRNKNIFVLYSLFGKTFAKFKKKEKVSTHFDPDFGLVAF